MQLAKIFRVAKALKFNTRAFSEGLQKPSTQTVDLDSKLNESAEPGQESSDESLQTVQDYKNALKYRADGQYRLSDEFFRRVLNRLKQSNQRETDDYVHTMKKLVWNQLILRRYTEAEAYLQEILEIQQSRTTNAAIIYGEYNNLFLHYLRTDLKQAILLGKALLSEEEKKKIPIIYQKQFLFNLGTAYLLQGNLIDAKSRLRECIAMQPNTLLKGYALNNLGLACWWHKVPNAKSSSKEITDDFADSLETPKIVEQEYSYSLIEKDFNNVIPILKNSIFNIEEVAAMETGERKVLLTALLDQNNIIPPNYKEFDASNKLIIERPGSGIPLLNISEFLLNTAPQKRTETTFWFKYAVKFYEKHDPNNIDRCLITLGLFSSSAQQYVKAEALFRKALEMLENSDSYNKILCLQLYGKMLKTQPNRHKEGSRLLTEAFDIVDKLPYWSNKLIHTSIPQLDL